MAPELETPAPTVNTAKQTEPEVSKIQRKEEEEDDWLAGALSRKKALSASNSEAKTSKQEDSLGLGEEVDLESFVRYSGSHTKQYKPVTEETCFSVFSDYLLLFPANKPLQRLPGAERTLLHLSKKLGNTVYLL